MKYFVFAVFLSLVFFACRKKKETPSVIVYATPTGSIAGKVYLSNETRILQPASAAATNGTVSIVGKPYSAEVSAKGTYTLNNVPAGVYDIAIQLPDGAGTCQQQVSFVGNGLLLLDFTTSTISTDTIQFSAKDTVLSVSRVIKVKATGRKSDGTTNKRIVIMYSTQSNIDPSNPETYFYSESGFMSSFSFQQVDAYENIILIEDFKKTHGLPSGLKIYVQAFPVSLYNLYYDYYSGKSVAKGVGKTTTPTAEIIIP